MKWRYEFKKNFSNSLDRLTSIAWKLSIVDEFTLSIAFSYSWQKTLWQNTKLTIKLCSQKKLHGNEYETF